MFLAVPGVAAETPKPNPAAKLDDQLGAAAASESDNPLLEVARQMQLVKGLIAEAQSGPKTQQMQGQIVAELDRLIKQARSACAQCKPSQGKTPGVAERQPTSPPKPEAKSESKPGQAGSKTVKSGDAKPGKSEARRPDTRQMLSVLKQHWGELPAHAREQMLQLPPEEFLPKHELLIEEYYKRLAEGGRMNDEG